MKRARPSLVAIASLACALASRSASADPIALRAPLTGRTLVGTFGTPEISAGAWLSDRFGFAIEWRLPVSSAGASVARRWTLVGERMSWGVDLSVAAGLVVPLIAPAGAVSLTPALIGRWRNQYLQVSASVVSPAVFQVLPEPAARLPLLFEVWIIGHYHQAHLGAQGSVGSVFVTGLSWAYAVQVSGFLGWDLDA